MVYLPGDSFGNMCLFLRCRSHLLAHGIDALYYRLDTFAIDNEK